MIGDLLQPFGKYNLPHRSTKKSVRLLVTTTFFRILDHLKYAVCGTLDTYKLLTLIENVHRGNKLRKFLFWKSRLEVKP